MRSLVFLFLIPLLAKSSFAQELSFINYSIENGLPQSQVSSFIQDKNGYLWIGTMGGLAKFNGQNFYTYSTRSNLVNNRITSLNSLHDSLLIGHEGGFTIGYNNNFKPFKFKENDKSVIVSKALYFKGRIYAFTNGSGYYVLKGNQLSHKELNTADENRIRTALVYKNQLFIATREGVLVSSDGENFEPIQQTKGLNISGMVIYSDGKLLFTTFNSEVCIYSFKSHSLHYIPIKQNIYGLRNCFKDSKNQIWIPHLDGIVLIGKSFKISYITTKTGLNYENINTVYEDNNQTIWIGSEGKGIFKFSGSHIRRYSFEKIAKTDLILATFKKGNNSYYGTYDGSLIIQNDQTNATQVVNVSNSPIWSLSQSSPNELLVGTGNGLYRMDITNNKVAEIKIGNPAIVPQKTTTIFTYERQSYIGGDFGLAIYKGGSIQRIISQDRFKLMTVRSLAYCNNRLYIGSDNGLFTLESDTLQKVLNFDTKVNALKGDTKDRIWIGTEDGLFLLKDTLLLPIYISERPSSNIINFINQDSRHIVIGTNEGVYYSRLQYKSFSFNKIGLEEGLSNLETNINSSFVDAKNNIIFGTVSGLNILNIDQLEKSYILRPPHIVLRDIAINFNPINKLKNDFPTSYDENGVITSIILPHNRNNILVDIDGVTLKNYRSLSYQYKVEGLDNAWSVKFKNPQINITNLPHGSYRILIRGVINDNLYSNIIVLNVVINPPFYLRAWFIILLVFLIIGLVYLIIQRRIQYEQRKNYQEKLEIKSRLGQLEQESLNASMNRHFIFNALNSIQYFINTQDRVSANRYLTSFAKLIRKNLDSSNESNNLVPLDEELERLKLYLDLEAMRFKDRFTYEIEDEESFADNYLVPAMLLQPFVENSILHGILPLERKGKITISINDFPNHIEIRIKDNGVGINQSMANKGMNASSHKSKGMEISSKRIDLLRKLYNKNFELIGPYQTTDENGLISGTTVLIKIPKENL